MIRAAILTGLIGALLLPTMPVAAASDAVVQRVEFPALKEFEGRSVTLSAWLYKPRGSGPFPALVLLHGCGGQYDARGALTASNHHWAGLLNEAGYVALLVDSYGPRGQRSICAQQQRTILVSRERVQDAYAALQWLSGRPDVDRERIGLIGWSNGGSGTLYSMLPQNLKVPGFRAAVAFYPGCVTLAKSKTPYRPYAPLLILSGEADDWTLAAPCVDLARIARVQGASAEIVTYPGAYHSFDRINLPVRVRTEVRNPNKPGGRGATAGEHPQAREDSTRRTLEFFAQHLKNPSPTEADRPKNLQ